MCVDRRRLLRENHCETSWFWRWNHRVHDHDVVVIVLALRKFLVWLCVDSAVASLGNWAILHDLASIYTGISNDVIHWSTRWVNVCHWPGPTKPRPKKSLSYSGTSTTTTAPSIWKITLFSWRECKVRALFQNSVVRYHSYAFWLVYADNIFGIKRGIHVLHTVLWEY